MRYIPGTSLADATKPLTDGALRQFAAGLAEALAALHTVGLTHRDVKPANIILTYDGPVLVDLGIAVSADATSITAEGSVIGTPTWMAPEQLENRARHHSYRRLGLGSHDILRGIRAAAVR